MPSRQWENSSEGARHAAESSDDAILQAEKFKATLVAPKDRFAYDAIKERYVGPQGLGPIDSKIQLLRRFDNDNKFFHVTCHIDDVIKSKIQRGEFVELEKLIPKEWSIQGISMYEHPDWLELVTEGNHAYVALVQDKTVRINSLRKWDQALRVYAAIYSEANPTRVEEIW